jgi:exonuclease VII small subunit
MSDRDLILQFLEKAEKRGRLNKRFNEIAATLAIAFVIPVTFKLLDLIFLFRGRTVTLFFGFWLAATVAWIVSRMRGRNPLTQVAANIDSKARLNDQLKTAYWFINNPRQSEWVDAQIQRTAQETGKIRIESLYPRKLPRTSVIACALLFLLIGLNFVPLSMNHNWVYLQAAPPFSLTAEERASLETALKLLEKAKAAENAELVQKIEDIMSALEQGEISLDDAIKQLSELTNELESGELDAANMTNGLEQMAAILRQAKPLQQAAQQMARGDLKAAAAQMRDLAGRLDSIPPEDLRDMGQRLHSASENPKGGLQDLARAFDAASMSVQRGDRPATQSNLDRIARELESLQQRLEDQALRSEAGDELSELLDSLEQREDSGESTSGEAGKAPSREGKAGQSNGEPPAPGERGEAQQGEAGGDPGEDGQPGEGGEPGEESSEAGNTPGESSEDAAQGQGGNSFGGSTKSAPLEGDATSLEVQLQREALQFEAAGGLEPDKNAEEAGERERSKLDYRNAPSDLSPAQKDLLNQDRIPFQHKQLIKNYFQAVKPKSK